MTALLAGDKPTAAELNLADEKIVVRGRRTTSSSASTGTTVGVLRLDDIPIEGGYSYTVRSPSLLIASTVANDGVIVTIRYTTDGSTPTTASPILPGAEVRALTPSTALGGPSLCCEGEYVPAVDETLSLLLCVVRNSGTGNVTLFSNGTSVIIEMKVYNSGPDVGDTGTDI